MAPRGRDRARARVPAAPTFRRKVAPEAPRAPEPAKSSGGLEVGKFGGASLADADGIRREIALITAHKGPLVVVVSALFGITDLLLEGGRRATTGRIVDGEDAAEQFEDRHRKVITELVRTPRERASLI